MNRRAVLSTVAAGLAGATLDPDERGDHTDPELLPDLEHRAGVVPVSAAMVALVFPLVPAVSGSGHHVPLMLGGAARFQEQNILASIAAAYVLGVRYDTPPQGSKAVLRSDAVALKPDGFHTAHILHATFLGRDIRYVLETTDGTRVTVDQAASSTRSPLSAGDEVRFSILTERLHFI